MPTSIPCQPALIRAGVIEESVAAARMEVACTSTADLEALIASARSPVQAAQEGQGRASQAVAERANRREAVQMTETTLDEQIQRVEAALCEALVERYRTCLHASG